MNVGVVGLGLIGGSFCKALKSFTDHKVFACDIKEDNLKFAEYMSFVDGELSEEKIGECDYILICIFPQAAIEWLEKNKKHLKQNAVVIDCCGIKRSICERSFRIAEKNGFCFLGGHPMAGFHKSGLKYSRDTMFKGASMIIVPPNTENIELLAEINSFFKSLGFGSVTVTDAETHDKNIAFTSQLAHVVSNAYVKSPQALVHKGFSAGSYKDLTRVAYLNEEMWSELFLENKDFLISEIDGIICELAKYSDALKQNDAVKLKGLLKDGKERKELIDK